MPLLFGAIVVVVVKVAGGSRCGRVGRPVAHASGDRAHPSRLDAVGGSCVTVGLVFVHDAVEESAEVHFHCRFKTPDHFLESPKKLK